MIHYLVGDRRSFVMRAFLDSWGRELAPRIRIVTYESLIHGRERLPDRGTYIFTNFNTIDAMDLQARTAIRNLHSRLVEENGASQVHNDPARSLRRYDLLRQLRIRGINGFGAWRANDPNATVRLPAFVRHEAEYKIKPVVAKDADQYQALLRGIKWMHGSLAGFIAVQFCDTADSAGIYRKYGAFIVGDRIVPRHIYYSRHWHMRSDDLSDLAMIEEEMNFLQSNPHAYAVRDCARIAGVSYGRFDYGLLDGRPQFWEVNTNPGVIFPPVADLPERKAVHLTFARMFIDAMAALDRTR
jgi:hypothetical protein